MSLLRLTSGLPLRRYAGMLMWSLSLAGGTQGADRTCSLLYGIAVGTMWLRILDFVLVQKDLSQVMGRVSKVEEIDAAVYSFITTPVNNRRVGVRGS